SMIGVYARLVGRFRWFLVDGVWLGSFILFSIPGMVLWARWFVAVPALLQERSGVLKSLARSRDLTKGSRCLLAGFWLGLFLVSFLTGLAARQWIFHSASLIRSLFYVMDDAVESVVMAVVMAVSYVELLRIKDGTSIEDLAEIFS
ncbi:MAG: hypothetical protein AB1440_11500, partial [Pseudomonadota bacterium]